MPCHFFNGTALLHHNFGRLHSLKFDLYKALAIGIIIIAENVRVLEQNKISRRKLSWIAPVQLCIGVASRMCACASHPHIHATYALRISQNFAEKTFADGSDTAKNAKVFSLQSFPLFAIL